MLGNLLSRILSLVFGVLYPAYCSYKALKNTNTGEIVGREEGQGDVAHVRVVFFGRKREAP